MKTLHILLLLAGITLTSPIVNAAVPSSRIIVIVNKDAITASDVDQRVRLINLSAGRPVTSPIPEELRKQIIQGMVDEILQLQAARAKKIKVEEGEVEKSLESLANDNKMSLGAMVSMLKSNGISKQTMMTRLKAQIAWGRYIREMYGPLVHIHDKEIKDYLVKAQEVKFEAPSSPDLMDVILARAIFNVKPDTPEEVMAFIGPKIEETHQSKGCSAFVKTAQGYGAKIMDNQAVKLGHLPDALKTMIASTKAGTCMQPIMAPEGLVLTMVCSKSMPKVAPPPPQTKDTALVALEQEKLGKRAAQEMAKLRAAAFIERRVGDQPAKGKQNLLRNAKYVG